MTHPYHHGALRAALLDAAETILERDGIAALTLRATAREAGVSHAAPSHHFGDLSGLLSALAASGFVRLRERIEAQTETAGLIAGANRMSFYVGYVDFARACPRLFQLMFRSERLDWSLPALAGAGAAAFALLAPTQVGGEANPAASAFQSLVLATAQWSLVHGLSTLLIDGRLEGVAKKLQPDIDIDKLIEGVLAKLVWTAH